MVAAAEAGQIITALRILPITMPPLTIGNDQTALGKIITKYTLINVMAVCRIIRYPGGMDTEIIVIGIEEIRLNPGKSRGGSIILMQANGIVAGEEEEVPPMV